MGFRIVTINREFGSGGRTIGKQVAQRMGVTCYDEELVTQIAKESGMSQSFLQSFSEEASATSSFLFTLNNWASNALSDQIYITQRKISRAKPLLLEQDLKIYEVADRLGFESAFYFSKVFKKVEGISPREFVQAHMNEPNTHTILEE